MATRHFIATSDIPLLPQNVAVYMGRKNNFPRILLGSSLDKYDTDLQAN